METNIIQLVTAFLGSIGFCLIFNLRKKLILNAAIGSVLCCGINQIGTYYFDGVFIPCLLAAAIATLYGEILARIKKAPATIFLLTAVMPVIPGSKLYYAMSSMVRKEWEIARENALLTAEQALAIAIGISLVWAISVMLQNILKND